jgi:GNAT superfamily N-acetyltransferase
MDRNCNLLWGKAFGYFDPTSFANHPADTMKNPSGKTGYQDRRVEYGVATEEDQDELFQLLYSVFHGSEEFLNRHRLAATRDPHYKPEQRHIVRVDGKIVGHVYTPHRVARIGISRVDIGGIMWMGCDPGQRRKGYGRQLMLGAIDYLKNQGCVASPLTATLFDFYRPLGYEAYHDEARTKISTLSLPKENDAGFFVREYDPSDLPGLLSIYDEFYETWTGTICRSREYWKWLLEQLGRDHLILIARHDHRMVGYAIYIARDPANLRRDRSLWECATIRGYAKAYQPLLGELRRRLSEQGVSELTLNLPLHHPMTPIVRGLGGTTELRQSYSSGLTKMMKIISLEAYLKGIIPELERRLVNSPFGDSRAALRVVHGGEKFSSPDAATLHLEEGKISVDDFPDVQDIVSGNERWIGAALIGYRGLAAACDLGLVNVSSDRARQLGSVLFPSTHPWRSDLDNDTG